MASTGMLGIEAKVKVNKLILGVLAQSWCRFATETADKEICDELFALDHHARTACCCVRNYTPVYNI